MFCLKCFSTSTSVVNSRPHKKQPSVWRRRHCSTCGYSFTTYERSSLQDNRQVILPQGEEPFNLGKLILSIANAFNHSPQEASYSSLWLAQTVEDKLSVSHEPLTPTLIAKITHVTLSQYDEIAALQYGIKTKLVTSTRRRGRPSLVWHEPPIDASPSQ